MTKQMLERRVKKAREGDDEYAKLEKDFFAWWARTPAEDPISSEAVGAYLRAAYGAGYIAGLKDA